MAGPFDDLIPGGQAPAQGPIFGPPLHPTPQTQDQAAGQSLQNVREQQQIDTQPLQNANTQTNIAQGQQSIASTQQQMRQSRATTASGLYKDYISDPTVKAYREVMPQVAQAMTSAPGGPGDISVIYAWAKAMDPTGSVREGDVQLGQSATGPLQQGKFLISQYHLEDGGKLPPDVRVGLIEAMRNKAGQLDHQYSAVHDHYIQTAKASGIDPSLIGPHEGQMYRPIEEQYIRSHGGTPRDPGAPQEVYQSQGQFGGGKDSNPFTPEQTAAYNSFLKANPQVSPDQLNAFIHTIGLPGAIGNAKGVTSVLNKTGQFSPAETAVNGDPRVTALTDQLNQHGGAGDAGAAGIAQGVTLSGADELMAAGDALRGSLGGQGSFGDLYNVNEQANQNHLDQLRQDHPYASAAGELGGGAVLAPLTFGAQTPGELAALSGSMGAVSGFNAGEGGLANRALGAAEGGAAGAALGYAIPKGVSMIGGRKAASEVPPLLDPQTGAMNQPLEAMTPGQRVVKAEEYGVNLPADAAGGRTAAVIGKGLDIMPGSAGVMEDARRATESQIAGASDVVASRFGNARTMNEAGSELQRGAQERIDRGKTVIGKAYNAIPIADKAQATTTNSVGTLKELTSRFESNPDLAATMKDPKLNAYLKALDGGKISWKDLKDFRSIIGEKIGEMRFGEGSSTSDLRALYGGLSEDMRNTAAAQGPRAVAAFERANNLNRQNEDLIQGALTRILGKDGSLAPEKAAAAVQAMTKGGKSTGDLRTLAQIKGATVKSGAWDEIASTLIRLGGQPANSAGRDFNPQTFVHWYADMAEPARGMLFGGTNNDLRKALDGFVAVNQRLQKVNALRNTSNTAGNMTAAGTVGTMAMAATSPILGVKLAAVMAGNYGMAKAWTNPSFVRWATGYSKAVATGSGSAVKSQIGRISALAATNPDLREPLAALQQRLLSAANDNVGRAAASPQNDQTNQQ